MGKDLVAEFLVDGLLRGDLKSKQEGYNIGRNGGWLSPNDIPRMENMNPLAPEIGDVYLTPQNMAPTNLLKQLLEDKINEAMGGRVLPPPENHKTNGHAKT